MCSTGSSRWNKEAARQRRIYRNIRTTVSPTALRSSFTENHYQPSGMGNSQLMHCRSVRAIHPVAVVLIFCAADSVADVDFNRDVRPILSDKCFHCHGPDEAAREADLRLDLESSVKSDRDGSFVVKPGDVANSELIRRITAHDESELMPPSETNKPLSLAEIRTLREWVSQGAPWSQHWAFVAPVRHDPPVVRNTTWPSNRLDHFILSGLEHQQLEPSVDADSITLLRRVSFDLTGLPPSEETANHFAKKHDTDSYNDLVDELLASPHFGERMAMYWLDLVRYADTVGYHGDQDQNISAYRDWVIDAFNDGTPFDQFTREQLAGDLLEIPTVSQRVATGYNRLLQTTHEGGLQQKEYRAIYAADRVRNISAVWMGATVGCAQCHDHKFDPYTAKDFYALAAFFDDIDDEKHFSNGTNSLPTRRDPELEIPTTEQTTELARLDAELAVLNNAKAKDLTPDEEQSRDRKLKAAVDARKQYADKVRRTMVTVALTTPRITRVLPRGNWLNETGEVVAPAVPEFLQAALSSDRRLTRLDLANWLVDAEHGAGLLTARVMVNRLWYLFFGTGLAADLDDFGGQGEPPVHPELLDRLAHELVDSQWNLKAVIRLIVTSHAYRQTSVCSPELLQQDPNNRLYARQSAFRLPAESVRDNALAISGLLQRQIGGLSVKPYQPAGYYRHLNFPVRKYTSDTDDRQWRRGLYVHWQRQFLHPMLKAFDAPSREECTAQRTRSNTPLAALTLLNDPTFVEAARAFATRCLQVNADAEDNRLTWAFQTAVTRPPTTAELQVLAALLVKNRELLKDQAAAASSLVQVGISKPDGGIDTTELAAWTAVCRAILNLAETNTRN